MMPGACAVHGYRCGPALLTPSAPTGPNSVTSEYSSYVPYSVPRAHGGPPWLTRVRRIWRSFVPFPAYQVFQRGGYYSVEVIPNSVAVISLNTMYFYDSNTGTLPHTRYLVNCILTSRHGDGAAVGGCGHSDPQDPGNLEFDWLEVQLQSFRDRKMQVRFRTVVRLAGHIIDRTHRSGCRDTSLRHPETISRNVLVNSVDKLCRQPKHD